MRDEQILVLNDQGGTVMHITYDMTEPLRANMKHHEPIILEPRSPDGMPRIYENGVVPTLNTCGGGTEYHASCKCILIEMTSTKNTIVTNEICPTLTSRMGTGGNQVNAVMVLKQKR